MIRFVLQSDYAARSHHRLTENTEDCKDNFTEKIQLLLSLCGSNCMVR